MQVIEATEKLDVTHLLDLPARVLSAGQKRRTAFAKLLCAPKALWILDEPSAALDTASDAQIQSLCAAHIEKGGAVIAATHLPFLSPETYSFSKTVHVRRYTQVEPV